LIQQELNIPVVYITGDDDQRTFSRALQTNPTGYIIKPFQADNLIMVLEMAIFRHTMTEKLRTSEELLSVTMKSIADGVVSTNQDGNIVFFNAAAERLTGLQLSEVKNTDFRKTLNLKDDTGARLFSEEREPAQSKKPVYGEAVLILKDSKQLPVSFSLASIRDDQNDFHGYIFSFRDISLIKKAENELKNMNRILEEKVARRTEELRQKNILLEKALAKEKEINEFRSKIVTTISHEFKTPLTTIFSSTELLERYVDNERLRSKAPRHFSLIKESVNLLSSHLSDILKFREFETLKETHPEPTEIVEFLERMIRFYQSGVGKHHELVFTHNSLPEELLIDRKLLREIAGNFISNAIKYSDEGTSVGLTADYADGNLRISVRDAGVGISKDDQEKLFEYFYRAKATENIEGSGLGLAIARQAVELLNGKIDVKSEPGKGSVFTVEFPVVTAN
jgi:PAS domain S-box-containing protein